MTPHEVRAVIVPLIYAAHLFGDTHTSLILHHPNGETDRSGAFGLMQILWQNA